MGREIRFRAIKVKSYIYWSKSEDGKLNGADFLGEGISDDTGRVPLIDGDFTYAIQVTHKATSGHPADTVLVVKRFDDKEYPVAVPDVATIEFRTPNEPYRRLSERGG